MSYVSSRKPPCCPSVTKSHLGPPAHSLSGDRVQEWHTSLTGTHKATVDNSTMHMPGPHDRLAQTYCMHEAKVLSCCHSAPLCSSKPIESPSRTHIPTYPAVHGSPDMCTDPGPTLLFSSVSLSAKTALPLCARPAVVRMFRPHAGI